MRAGEKLESPSGRGFVELLNQLSITTTCCTAKAPQQQWNYRKIRWETPVWNLEVEGKAVQHHLMSQKIQLLQFSTIFSSLACQVGVNASTVLPAQGFAVKKKLVPAAPARCQQQRPRGCRVVLEGFCLQIRHRPGCRTAERRSTNSHGSSKVNNLYGRSKLLYCFISWIRVKNETCWECSCKCCTGLGL